MFPKYGVEDERLDFCTKSRVGEHTISSTVCLLGTAAVIELKLFSTRCGGVLGVDERSLVGVGVGVQKRKFRA